MKIINLTVLAMLIPKLALALFATHGDLILLRYVPGDKTAKIFLAGNKLANIDFNKDAKLISVVMFSGQDQEVLKLDGSGTSYQVERAGGFPRDYELIFKTEVRGKKEDLKLKIENKP